MKHDKLDAVTEKRMVEVVVMPDAYIVSDKLCDELALAVKDGFPLEYKGVRVFKKTRIKEIE